MSLIPCRRSVSLARLGSGVIVDMMMFLSQRCVFLERLGSAVIVGMTMLLSPGCVSSERFGPGVIVGTPKRDQHTGSMESEKRKKSFLYLVMPVIAVPPDSHRAQAGRVAVARRTARRVKAEVVGAIGPFGNVPLERKKVAGGSPPKSNVSAEAG